MAEVHPGGPDRSETSPTDILQGTHSLVGWSRKSSKPAPLFVHHFQNAGESNARTVKISSLPSNMHTVSITLPKGMTIS